MSIGGHDPQRSTAENYLMFGREARGRSPAYESLSAAVADGHGAWLHWLDGADG